MLSITMGSRNTVPFKMLRMVPLGLFHICGHGRGRGGGGSGRVGWLASAPAAGRPAPGTADCQ